MYKTLYIITGETLATNSYIIQPTRVGDAIDTAAAAAAAAACDAVSSSASSC